ncbi:unnamed protein product [Thelazia callipaeda]|uniref:ANK_REP_REGION domain-containing protein n=1 Tax=Thelazia callipaeda TaxID=103827 RepID=A0A0N5D785_THECL|nr:unnamed protein product [Thelazia callipaeda]
MISAENERWLNARIDTIKMRNIFHQGAADLPAKLQKVLLKFDPNEMNSSGQSLIHYLDMLIRAGCDPSEPDKRRLRTPLMMACILRNGTVAQFLINSKVNLAAADRLGNTALMYAVIHDQTNVVGKLVSELTRQWSFNVFQAKNMMGFTAEDLALRNGRNNCSKYKIYNNAIKFDCSQNHI